MAWIKLTHLVGNKPKDIYVNVDQICRVGDSVGAAAAYSTNILFSNGSADVQETVADVMRLISQPNVST